MTAPNTTGYGHREVRTAFFAGSFDPFTVGHASIVERGLEMFDRVVVAIGVNSAKRPWQPLEERLQRLRRLYGDQPRVEVTSYEGLTVDAAAAAGARWLLRGVRSVADFEYERTLAEANRNISQMESVLLYALPQYEWLSSSVVRELASHGRDISPYLPSIP